LHAQEFRAMWVDAFHAGLRNGTETSAVVAAARNAKCNAIILQVRKRGDAYYRNGLEPVATDVTAGFDPLSDLIQKAHSGSPRVEVHAWIVSFNIWNSRDTLPSQVTHPYRLHPDWLCENNVGEQWAGDDGDPSKGNYHFDPGHPGVQQHTFNVAMDIVQRYDVDGIHLDYIRYSESGSSVNNQPWGYNPVTLARFKTLTGRTATPSPTDTLWLQWRRDQVTALVRKLYLNVWATKPNVRVSAALIPWGTAPNLTLSSWQATNAYGRVLQDWRGWMEEGILDLACPMIYRTDNSGFGAWADFTKERQYNRAAAMGMGWYLNSLTNTIAQIKLARAASAGGKLGVGVIGYSYAVPNKDSVSQANTWKAFTDDATAEMYDPGGTPVFASVPAVPSMPWKTNTTKGHVMGYVRNSGDTAVLDGATVTIAGPANRTLATDGTGFFGSVDLPVGNYTMQVAAPGYRSTSKPFTITGASVSQPSVQLEMVPFEITSVSRSAAGDKLTVAWNSIPGRAYRIETSSDMNQWGAIAGNIVATTTSSSYQWTIPLEWRTRAFVRIKEGP
jgi:uncharacterized lipoprotein YddW (UPF0748 family)